MTLNVTRISPRGVSIVAWAPGFHVYGITVDNPSGWWLLISPGDYYVPPFTFGWRQYLNGVTSVSVRCVEGPGALQSQDIGNPITVVVSASKIDNSAGYTTLGPGAITSDLIAANVVIVGSINQVTNTGATVIIDSTGIRILDGFLSIEDEFGSTVLAASGFSGTWQDFVALGIYNGRWTSGVVGVIPLGRTASLPYWTVSNVSGTPTLELLSGGGIKFSYAAINTTKRVVSDRVPVLPSHAYEGGISFSWARGAGQINLTATVLWYKKNGTASLNPTTTIVADSQPAGAAGAQDSFGTAMYAPNDAYFAEIRIDSNETGSHSATNAYSVFACWLVPTPIALAGTSLHPVDIDGLIVGANAGFSLVLQTIGDISVIGVATISGNVTLGAAGILLGGATAAELQFTDGGAAVMLKAKSILLSTSYADPDPSNAGIQFGADVNLLRRAANILHTDDELEYRAAGRKLSKTTTLSLAHNAWTQISAWTTTDWAGPSTSLQNNGIKVTRAGIYHVTGTIEFAAATDYTRLIIGVGVGANTTPAAPAAIDEVTHSPNTANVSRHVNGSWDMVLAADDVVGLFGHHVNGAAAARNAVTALLSLVRVSDS